MRINKKRGNLYLRELYSTNPEFIKKKFFLMKTENGKVFISTNDFGSLELKKVKVSQSNNCFALTDKLLINYMLKYSENYNYIVTDENNIILKPKLNVKTKGTKK